MRIQKGQIAPPTVDPKMSFKMKIVRVFCGRSPESHVIEKSGVRSAGISASLVYPRMLKKTNLFRGFSEDFEKNFLYENKGVIRMGEAEKKGNP